MPLTEKEVLLAGFDDAWSHKWESFETISKDLTEEEAQYQHPAYANDMQEDGWPRPGTILWQLAHMEYWYRYYIDCLTMIPEAPEELPTPIELTTLAEAMSRVLSTRAQLREKIAALPESTLDFMIKGRTRVSEFIRMMARHDTWHSSQISVARRLYRNSKQS